jgi:hypothetical protein
MLAGTFPILLTLRASNRKSRLFPTGISHHYNLSAETGAQAALQRDSMMTIRYLRVLAGLNAGAAGVYAIDAARRQA